MYKAFSNQLYTLAGGTWPELLMSMRYHGRSLKRARAAVLPLQPGCEALIETARGRVVEAHGPA